MSFFRKLLKNSQRIRWRCNFTRVFVWRNLDVYDCEIFLICLFSSLPLLSLSRPNIFILSVDRKLCQIITWVSSSNLVPTQNIYNEKCFIQQIKCVGSFNHDNYFIIHTFEKWLRLKKPDISLISVKWVLIALPEVEIGSQCINTLKILSGLKNVSRAAKRDVINVMGVRWKVCLH